MRKQANKKQKGEAEGGEGTEGRGVGHRVTRRDRGRCRKRQCPRKFTKPAAEAVAEK